MSAVAVIVTIGFLAFQMMDNTNALQAQMFQELMRDTNDWRESVGDPTTVELRARWRDEGFESLTRLEQLQIRGDDLLLWGIYESAYYANERGILGSKEWIRFETAICRARHVMLIFGTSNELRRFLSCLPLNSLNTSKNCAIRAGAGRSANDIEEAFEGDHDSARIN